eukprot:Gb_38078 [translate_table: standard]
MAKDMMRRCSHCGQNGHNSRTCPDRGVKLFGVRLTTEGIMMRKSVSMGNLVHYRAFSTINPSVGTEQSDCGAAMEEDGYLSDGLVHSASKARERKKGVPWTEEEHRMFLAGLEKLGKGDWRGISRNYVTTRTPTQVASHAQKYFLRQSSLNKRKRRSSLFDMAPDAVTSSMAREDSVEKLYEISPGLILAPGSSLVNGNYFEPGVTADLALTVGTFPISTSVNLPSLSLGGSQPGLDHVLEKMHVKDPTCVTPSNQFSFPPLPLPLWPESENPSIDTKCRKVIKTIASVKPSAALNKSLENSELNLSIAPPMPVQMNNEPSRHSAFYVTDLNSKGNMSSAISVV